MKFCTQNYLVSLPEANFLLALSALQEVNDEQNGCKKLFDYYMEHAGGLVSNRNVGYLKENEISTVEKLVDGGDMVVPVDFRKIFSSPHER